MNRLNALLALLAWYGALSMATGQVVQTHPDRTAENVVRDLEEVARISSVMVDGDLCQRIMTRRALEHLFREDPRDPWIASDNFDVNHEPFILTKKTLIRLSRLLPYPADVNLWMPLTGKADKIQILIRNVNEWSQFWTWGVLAQEIPAEMKRVLESGNSETVMGKRGMISVLSPVFNSLGEIVGLVEVVAIDPQAKPPDVHARLRSPQADR